MEELQPDWAETSPPFVHLVFPGQGLSWVDAQGTKVTLEVEFLPFPSRTVSFQPAMKISMVWSHSPFAVWHLLPQKHGQPSSGVLGASLIPTAPGWNQNIINQLHQFISTFPEAPQMWHLGQGRCWTQVHLNVASFSSVQPGSGGQKQSLCL